MRRKRITFKVSVDVDSGGNYTLFNGRGYICCKDVKECFLDHMAFVIHQYGIESDKKLTKNARRIKKAIRDSVTIKMMK